MKTRRIPKVKRNTAPRSRCFEDGNGASASRRHLKGQSGILAGRPKFKQISAALQAYLALELGSRIKPRTYAEMVACQLLRLARKGNLAAIRKITNRVEGRPRQASEIQECDPLSDLISEMRRVSASLPPVEGEKVQ